MKSLFFGLLATLLLVGGSGCAHRNSGAGCRDGCNGGCNECGIKGAFGSGMTAHGDPVARQAHANPRAFTGAPGPPTAAVSYPYYTTRGPRDFLLDNPRTIGP